ncbi:MAG: MGMT family protein [Acidobacteria bacterium]|nr:MGMT family protein [Acidobacteriota bacterium]
MKTRASWREKLERVQEPKVVRIPPKLQKRFGTRTMLIPRPLDVDALIRQVPKGKLVTQSRIRERLAQACGADVTCPITTGIFVRIAAEAAEEDARAGKKRITPYWRVIRDNGSLIEKFPGGVEGQARRLRQEGHRVRAGKVLGFGW